MASGFSQIPATAFIESLAHDLSLAAICFDRSDGRLIYRSDIFAIEDPGPVHELNSHATPPPAVEPLDPRPRDLVGRHHQGARGGGRGDPVVLVHVGRGLLLEAPRLAVVIAPAALTPLVVGGTATLTATK